MSPSPPPWASQGSTGIALQALLCTGGFMTDGLTCHPLQRWTRGIMAQIQAAEGSPSVWSKGPISTFCWGHQGWLAFLMLLPGTDKWTGMSLPPFPPVKISRPPSPLSQMSPSSRTSLTLGDSPLSAFFIDLHVCLCTVPSPLSGRDGKVPGGQGPCSSPRSAWGAVS